MADITNEYDRRRRMAELSQRVAKSQSELSTSASYGGTTGQVRQPIVGPKRVSAPSSAKPASASTGPRGDAPPSQFTVNPQWGAENIREVTDIMTEGRGGTVVPARSGIAGAWDALRSKMQQFSGRHASWFRR